MKKYLLGLLFIAPLLLFFAPTNAFAGSNFAGLRVVIHQSNGTMLNNIGVNLSTNSTATYTGGGITRHCQTGVETYGAFVNLNPNPDTYYTRINGLKTGGAYTYGGQYYDNGNGILYFGNGVNSTLNGGGMGFGFACSCNPLIVSIGVPSGYYLDKDRDNKYDSGDINENSTFTDSIGSMANDSTKYLDYIINPLPVTGKHSITPRFNLNSDLATNKVFSSDAYYNHQDPVPPAIPDGIDKITAQWFYKAYDGATAPADWDSASSGWLTISPSARIKPESYTPYGIPEPLASQSQPLVAGRTYKFKLVVCDAGELSQISCPWTDATQTVFDLTKVDENGYDQDYTNNILVTSFVDDISIPAKDLVCTVVPQSGEADLTVKVTATVNGGTTNVNSYSYAMGDGSATLTGRPSSIFYTYGAVSEVKNYTITVTHPDATSGACTINVTVKPPKDGSGGEVSWLDALKWV